MTLVLRTLDIRDGTSQRTRPVDQPVGPIYEVSLVQSDEGLGHGPGHFGIHGEDGSIPVNRATEFSNLVIDCRTVFLLPFPDFFDKFFAPQVVSAITENSTTVHGDKTEPYSHVKYFTIVR